MVYYPQWAAPYPPVLILHGQQIEISVNPIIIIFSNTPPGGAMYLQTVEVSIARN